MSVQHVEVGADGRARLQTDLADRAMLQTQLLYHDIPMHWYLSPVAMSKRDCVPLSLCEVLGTDFEATKKRLEELSGEYEGFCRKDVLAFLEEHSRNIGQEVGWKIFQNGIVVAERRGDAKAPFISLI